MKVSKKIIAVLGAAFLLGACSQPTSTPSKKESKLNIMTTFFPMYDFTRNIVGEEGNVTLLISAGTEPHEYDPTAKDIAKISQSDALVYDNENMETWVPTVMKSLTDSKVKEIKATKDMELLPIEEEHEHEGEEHHDEHEHEFDPHVWLSPKKAKLLVEKITAQLSEAFPEKASAFKTNAQAYLEKLTELDNEYTTALKDAKQKNFVTQHTAFRYLATDYGLNQVGIAGISPEAEPSPARLAELTKYIKENEIRYIYFEENASEKIAKTLATETGVVLEVLNPLESLTKEEMDKGDNYISVMKENLQALLKTTTVAGKEIKPEH